MSNTAFISGMTVTYDKDSPVIPPNGVKYFDATIEAPWGLVNQRVRADRLVDRKGNDLFPREQAATT